MGIRERLEVAKIKREQRELKRLKEQRVREEAGAIRRGLRAKEHERIDKARSSHRRPNKALEALKTFTETPKKQEYEVKGTTLRKKGKKAKKTKTRVVYREKKERPPRDPWDMSGWDF